MVPKRPLLLDRALQQPKAQPLADTCAATGHRAGSRRMAGPGPEGQQLTSSGFWLRSCAAGEVNSVQDGPPPEGELHPAALERHELVYARYRANYTEQVAVHEREFGGAPASPAPPRSPAGEGNEGWLAPA